MLLGRTAGITITNGELIVTLGTKTTISFATITHLALDLVTIGRNTKTQTLALCIESQQTKPLKIHLEFFDRYRELLQIIVANTSEQLEISGQAKTYMQQKNIQL